MVYVDTIQNFVLQWREAERDIREQMYKIYMEERANCIVIVIKWYTQTIFY